MSALFSPLVELAIETAAEWHDGTYRKGRWTDPCTPAADEATVRVPTMAHVTAVALTVQRAGWSDEAVAAAFLHDALEDRNRHRQRLDRAALAARVGEAVTQIVEAVSEPQLDAGGRPIRWRERKEAYLHRLAAGPPEAAAVSLADKLHNAYAMASSLEAGIDIFCDGPGRRALSAGPDEQLWFFDAVLDASRTHTDARLDPMRQRLSVEVGRLRRALDLDGDTTR
ncbi:MAG: HD domain-containing protein [Bacteroidota bacterium]